jgi:hypothetical protein
MSVLGGLIDDRLRMHDVEKHSRIRPDVTIFRLTELMRTIGTRNRKKTYRRSPRTR